MHQFVADEQGCPATTDGSGVRRREFDDDAYAMSCSADPRRKFWLFALGGGSRWIPCHRLVGKAGIVDRASVRGYNGRLLCSREMSVHRLDSHHERSNDVGGSSCQVDEEMFVRPINDSSRELQVGISARYRTPQKPARAGILE